MPIDPEFAANYRRAWARLLEARPGHGTVLEQYNEKLPLEAYPRLGLDTPVLFVRQERARAVVRKYGVELIETFPTATAVAVSFKYVRGRVLPDPCITFFVGKKIPAELLRNRLIPKEIEGVATDVVEAGLPRLQQTSGKHQPGARHRPAQPGMSIAHPRVTSGTFGCLVADEYKTPFIMSCAHVLSDAAGVAGDDTLQPASHYGGARPQDRIAQLTRTVPLASGVCIADAGIAEADPADVIADVLSLGKPTGVRNLDRIGEAVQKFGDQTGLTTGFVVGINATIGPLQINGTSNVFFDDAIITTGMSEGGDSGSLLMDNALNGIGILFGGLVTGSTTAVTWFNPLQVILNNLGVSLVK